MKQNSPYGDVKKGLVGSPIKIQGLFTLVTATTGVVDDPRTKPVQLDIEV